jgi:hypothetical protein
MDICLLPRWVRFLGFAVLARTRDRINRARYED